MIKELEPQSVRIHRAVASEGRLYFGFRATRLFFNKTLEDISQNPPTLARRTQQTWERNLAITTAYLETDQTLEEVTKQYGLTRQRADQVVKDTLGRLHTYSTPKTRLLFPSVEWLTFRKPLSQKSRERSSAAGGGASLQVARMLAERKSAREIMEETGSSAGRLSNIRRRLASWGRDVPYLTDNMAHRKLYQTLSQKLKDEALPREEVARLLDQVTSYFCLNYAAGKDDPPFIAVSTLARQVGLHISLKGGQTVQDLLSALRDFGIPVKSIVKEVKQGPQKGVQTYYLIAASSRRRAQEVFSEHPDLQKFREIVPTIPAK